MLFGGFQAAGTRGRALQDGAGDVRIHGRRVPVRARVETLTGVSAHADQGEVLSWLSQAAQRPRSIHLVHGEPEAASVLAGEIRDRLDLDVDVPEYRQKVSL